VHWREFPRRSSTSLHMQARRASQPQVTREDTASQELLASTGPSPEFWNTCSTFRAAVILPSAALPHRRLERFAAPWRSLCLRDDGRPVRPMTDNPPDRAQHAAADVFDPSCAVPRLQTSRPSGLAGDHRRGAGRQADQGSEVPLRQAPPISSSCRATRSACSPRARTVLSRPRQPGICEASARGA
jgi:hypothetical protein